MFGEFSPFELPYFVRFFVGRLVGEPIDQMPVTLPGFGEVLFEDFLVQLGVGVVGALVQTLVQATGAKGLDFDRGRLHVYDF